MRGRGVDAVDEIGVLEPRGSADVHRVAGVIARVSVCQEYDDGTVIATDRQRVVGGRIDVRSDRRARGIDGKPLGCRADLPEFDRLGLDRDDANVRCATDPDGDAVDDDGSEPDPRQPDGVATGRQGEHLERAPEVRSGPARSLETRSRDDHPDIRDGFRLERYHSAPEIAGDFLCGQ